MGHRGSDVHARGSLERYVKSGRVNLVSGWHLSLLGQLFPECSFYL